jgi:exopolysaccharide biosynthesis polyprenyl glycosylphosphotransferase
MPSSYLGSTNHCWLKIVAHRLFKYIGMWKQTFMSDSRLLYSPYEVTRRRAAFKGKVKRAMDVVISMTAIMCFWPLFLIAAIAIRLDSSGPIIFRQRRGGLNGKEFVIFKFRTMTVLEDGPVVTQVCWNDPRVTRIGKLLRRSSLDEVPQLFNVLRGDMSMVGPRPHALAHDHKYRVQVKDYTNRSHVKPGMTGWAQVNGLRGETPCFDQMAERVKFDLWYVNHWSLRLDLYILLRTGFEVFR